MSQVSGHEKARLCHVIKSETFDGYGFNLHAEKGKIGQFIGKVDEGSPAEKAGLKQGDRILEVNGASIANETHKQVVQRIKSVPNETRLLVITPGEGEDTVTIDTRNEKTTKQEDTEKNDKATPQLNLGMTAAELRAKLLAKKKYDPKKESLDLKKKYDIVQKL
ncbi:Na(+)/H(+) exchange regulatory cofactor NHE-RF2 [Ctenocephalides felis]|uniref:Na(+)/H(+) exchange regulatory cofactor NHE-RF2 n=1 Tax=Ctenocephalides felis TaxID=7515 RepID=UPI000E6E3CBE|nr:Na(+)/H(+) exchange regulatory cofactor NHE-RF2 [Ctenocephalides felis]